jgi:hypothetical protein
MDEQKLVEGTESEQPASPPPDESDRTAIGQVVQSFSRITRQLPAAPVDRRTSTQVASAALRERIATLVVALGDPAHSLHQRAVDDLVIIGPPAVPQLSEALAPQRPWLTAYRAAEALGRIGDGRAASPLLEALRHPNSNVRWSAIRALATVGDARALIDLRRVARTDQSKTSWGEPVGGAAQSVLEQMQGQNVLLRGADLIKTAIACVFMLVALVLAWSFFSALRQELDSFGISAEPVALGPIVRTAVPTALPSSDAPTPAPQVGGTQPGGEVPTPDAAALQPTLASTTVVTATVLTGGNVRAQPAIAAGNVIGAVNDGDVVMIVASTSDQQWYRLSLTERRAASSRINTADQTGWVARSLLSPINAAVPVEEAAPPAQPPTPTPTPQP